MDHDDRHFIAASLLDFTAFGALGHFDRSIALHTEFQRLLQAVVGDGQCLRRFPFSEGVFCTNTHISDRDLPVLIRHILILTDGVSFIIRQVEDSAGKGLSGHILLDQPDSMAGIGDRIRPYIVHRAGYFAFLIVHSVFIQCFLLVFF